MIVSFFNPGEIDIDAAIVQGVNAKDPHQTNPIGQFGTGLKYGIAKFLATGHKVTIWKGQHPYSFTSKKLETRGKTYDRVYMNDSPLGFTTFLGNHWELWQAFRELYTNAVDESGGVTNSSVQPLEGTTVIWIDGPNIQQVWENLPKILLKEDLLKTFGNLEVHRGCGIFLKGILVEEANTSYAYNLLSVKLTEDRTLSDPWAVHYDIIRLMSQSGNCDFIKGILENSTVETEWPWYGSPSVEVAEVLLDRLRSDRLPQNIHDVAYKGQKLIIARECREANPVESKMIQQALEELALAGIQLDDTTSIKIMDSCAGNLLGRVDVKTKIIYLASQMFQRGQVTVTGTLLEELIHLNLKLDDHTRAFQSYTIDLCATLLGIVSAQQKSLL